MRYCALFHFIKTEIEVNWNPSSVAIDFEKASIAAIRQIFPVANIFGCFFHHSQCIWLKIQQNGLTQLYRNNSIANKLIRMFMAIPLLPQHKTREGYDTLIEFFHVELEDQLDVVQKHQIHDFFRYYFNTWISGHLGSILSVSNRVRRTNNSLEVSHRHLIEHIGIPPNPSLWLFVDKLLAYSLGKINDFTLAVDGVDITQELPRKWKKQNKRIRVATERLQERRFNVLEFLKYTKHSTPLFDLENDQADENYDLIEEIVSLQGIPISRNGSLSLLINSPFASDVENIQDLDDVPNQNEINVMSPDAQLNDEDSDDSVFPFMRRRANVLNNHSGDENEELHIQEEFQWNEQDFIISEEMDPDVMFMLELNHRRRMAEIEDLPFVQVEPVSDSETIVNIDNICVVCRDSIRTHAFIPCGDCLLLLHPKRCPMCNQPFTTYLRIWS